MYLPYVMVRFGLRNRLTYLAGTLFLLGIPVFTLNPRVYGDYRYCLSAVIIAALASPLWRRQMIFLAANFARICRLVFYFCVRASGTGHLSPRPISGGLLWNAN